MTWLYRLLCCLYVGGYWVFYHEAISWRLPVTGLAIFALTLGLSEIGAIIFIAAYPALLYLNQYPQQQFSAVTFLVVALILGLSFHYSAHLWIPIAIVVFYFSISLFRYRPDWVSIFQGIWTTDQMSATLFVGTCVMWASGIMLFDYLRGMKPRSLYYALIGQGAVFAAMCIANIWLRGKPIGPGWYYFFLFGDPHSFAAYLILQVGLLVVLWHNKRELPGWPVGTVLFVVDSLLLVASYSRSGIGAYLGMVFLYIMATASLWVSRQHWKRLKVAVLVLLAGIAVAAAYRSSQLIAKTDSIYKEVEPIAPAVPNRAVISRLGDLKALLIIRMNLITPEALYIERIRNWAVPLAVVRDYPIFGIGVGGFYRNSERYATGVPDLFGKKYPENAHNYYLQIAAEAGLTGLVLFIVFMVWLFWRHLKLTDPIKLGCGIALAGLMIFSLPQHPLLVDRLFFVFVMICATLANRQTAAAKS